MSQDTGLYFAQFPRKFDSLRAVVVSVGDDGHGRNSEIWSGARQFYREIIFTEPDLLIGPQSEEYGSSDKAVIIAENCILDSEKLITMLKRFCLQTTASIPVTRNLFLHCFEFVMSHRLAPLWNKIGPYYVKGRDFLQEKGKLCAMKADLSLTDKITLGLKAQMLRLPLQQFPRKKAVTQAKIEEFGVSPNILRKFRQSDAFSIDGLSLENNTCLVLPSLKTGYITRISHGTRDEFDFKRYWKVMYGFRLPGNPSVQDVIYSVCFTPSGKIFFYPECCIRSKEPHVYLRCDQKALFSSFIEDLESRLPSLYGSPLTFTSSVLYPTKAFYSATISKQSNLTRSTMSSNARQPFVFTARPAMNVLRNGTAEYTAAEETTKNVQNSFQSRKTTEPSAGVTLYNTKPYVPCFTKQRSSGKTSKKVIPIAKNQPKVKAKPMVPSFSTKSTSAKSSTSCKRTNVHQTKNNFSTAKVSSGVAITGEKQNLSVVGNNERETTVHKTSRSLLVHQPSKSTGPPVDSKDLTRQRDMFGKEPISAQACKRKRTEKKSKAEIADFDMRELAVENKISKVSAVAISKWLKSEGVQCRSKAKKAELILKVYEYLQLSQPEA